VKISRASAGGPFILRISSTVTDYCTVDTTLIYQPVNNWELDAGVNIGVTKAANDLFNHCPCSGF